MGCQQSLVQVEITQDLEDLKSLDHQFGWVYEVERIIFRC